MLPLDPPYIPQAGASPMLGNAPCLLSIEQVVKQAVTLCGMALLFVWNLASGG